jgi:signal transduction histidine kinase/NAD-dependent dihydropyrimidine dehydrogenase PreA subunit
MPPSAVAAMDAGTAMGIVSTIPEKCRRCYACVRECPAKAIKVIAGQATVIAEQCVACGNCVKVCTQKAKRIEDATLVVGRLLADAASARDATLGAESAGDVGAQSAGDVGAVIAIIAPSFPVAFPDVTPGRIVGALRRLGFAQVWEAAFGAELVSREYARLAQEAIRGGQTIVSTPCPAIVSYVQKYVPVLRAALAPVVSPMIATARAIKARHGAGVRIVFIGPCIAKKAEIKDPLVQGTVDAVLTYEELLSMFAAAGVSPQAEKESDFDGPSAYLGRSIPIPGGLLRAAGIDADILQNNVLVTEGKDRVLPVFRELADGKSRTRVADVLFCEGCINGPKMTNALSGFARKEMLTDYINERNRLLAGQDVQDSLVEFGKVDLSRGFRDDAVVLPQPAESEIAAALQRMRKFGPEDQLNCGSCGYPSCRDKAVAVCQGLAEVSMCLPYLVEELEGTLSMTQDKLVQTERLASMGQISAGVAHEINNPLSTILLYSHMLLKAHHGGDPESEDIQMIVSEANRCRTIMRGLLDFARQSRVVKTPTNLGRLVQELADAMNVKLDPAVVRVRCEVAPGLPLLMLDADQVRQMLLNLVQNGIDAVEERAAEYVAVEEKAAECGAAEEKAAGTPGDESAAYVGEVVVNAALSPREDLVHLRVSDTGRGMPPEVIKDIFTPFYTTKQLGKGTGMGLSIVYGVVKMHAGDIAVDSEVGRGTSFLVRLPVEREESHGHGTNSSAG